MAPRGQSAESPHVALVLDGQFRVDALVGAGAMARVYRARQLAVERDVAVKILRRELVRESEIAARFRREARIAASLPHPHVIVVHATGEVPEYAPDAGGEPYVALELLDGPPLSDALERAGGALPLSRALHVVLALCDAVGEAHARGIVHRDIKPENVILIRRGDDDDFVKLLDFGLAKTLAEAPDLRTRAGAVLGTPRYVSPEGAEGRPVSAASDCYALATLLYRCLSGRTPFDAENAVRLLLLHTSAPPPELQSVAEQAVPDAIARVVMQNLAKRPEARAADARALGRALVAAARAANVDIESIGLSSTLLGTAERRVPVELRPTERRDAPAPPPAAPEAARTPAKAEAALAPAEPAPLLDSASSSFARQRRAQKRLYRRLALFVACFVLGAVAALGIASSLGAFAPAPGGRLE